jgi:hypothetical protein
MHFVMKAGETGSRGLIEGSESQVHSPKGRRPMLFNARCSRKQQNLLALEKREDLCSFYHIANGLVGFRMPAGSYTDRARMEGMTWLA